MCGTGSTRGSVGNSRRLANRNRGLSGSGCGGGGSVGGSVGGGGIDIGIGVGVGIDGGGGSLLHSVRRVYVRVGYSTYSF